MNDAVAIMRAADFAARKRTNQKRKGEEAEPYLNHLIEVAALVAEATDGRPDAVIAALLHDAVEDQDVTNAQIADLFGPAVANLVAEVTDDKSLPKQLRKDKQIGAATKTSNAASQSGSLNFLSIHRSGQTHTSCRSGPATFSAQGRSCLLLGSRRRSCFSSGMA